MIDVTEFLWGQGLFRHRLYLVSHFPSPVRIYRVNRLQQPHTKFSPLVYYRHTLARSLGDNVPILQCTAGQQFRDRLNHTGKGAINIRFVESYGCECPA